MVGSTNWSDSLEEEKLQDLGNFPRRDGRDGKRLFAAEPGASVTGRHVFANRHFGLRTTWQFQDAERMLRVFGGVQHDRSEKDEGMPTDKSFHWTYFAGGKSKAEKEGRHGSF